MAYSFWTIYIALIISLFLIIASIVLQVIAANHLPTAPLATASSNSVANNKTAQTYINGSAFLNVALAVGCLVALFILPWLNTLTDTTVIDDTRDYQLNWVILFLILPLISIIVIILLGIGYSFISSTVTTTNNVSYSQILTISAIVINVVVFIILITTYFWGLGGYNQYIQELYDK